MRKIVVFLMLAAMAATSWGQEKVLRPVRTYLMPKVTYQEWQKLAQQLDESPDFNYDAAKYGDLTIFDDLYSGKCSWYCGGEVKKVTASSCLAPQGKFTYKGENAHDFDHESVWATKGSGVGQSLTYTFEGRCPRITEVKILNGHVKNETAWKNNSRVKKLRVWYQGKPYATLLLSDTRSMQCFELGTLGYHDDTKPDWTLKFEVLEIYPGTKYQDTVIAELFFDGIDVH